MGRISIGLVLLALLFAPLTPSHAGLFRKSKPEPAKYVPMLIQVLKEDTEEQNRVRAAEELREYDPKNFPDILPALTEALTNDPSFKVRAESAESLGKINLVSPKSGYALEQSQKYDSAKSVREASRAALLQYRVRGYRSGKESETTSTQTQEPPLARPSTSPTPPTSPTPSNPGTSVVRPPVQATPAGFPKGSVVIGGRVQTPEPPLAKPLTTETGSLKPSAPPVIAPPMIPITPEIPTPPTVPVITTPSVPVIPSAPTGPSLQGPALGFPPK